MTTPTAVFVYVWTFGEKPMEMYRIIGGPCDQSDVTADTLRKMGIPVPMRTVAA